MFSRTAFRRTVPSRSSSTATGDRRRPGRRQISWSPAEAAETIAAPGLAVTSPADGNTVTAADRVAEDRAVAARLDRAWRRLAAAHDATEGRPGGIGDDAARRDPVTRPVPIAFGTPTRTPRSTAPVPVAPAAGVPAPPALPAPAAGMPAVAPPVRRSRAASMHRPAGVGQVPRVRAPRRLTADRWSAAVG